MRTLRSTPANAVNAEVRGCFFIARNVPLNDGTNNSIVASTYAETLADHSPSSDTVSDVALDTSLNVSYTYDANGNLTVKSEEGGSILWTYTYSVDDWLIKVEGPDNFVEQYTYDPAGRKYKIETTEGAETTTRYFVYDDSSILLALDEDKDLDKEFVRGLGLGGGIGGLLYTCDANGSLAYFHYDGRGNVVSITDDSRTEVAYYEYDAWGNILTQCGSLANEHRFLAQHSSLATGLIDFGYRWYDPTVGRWTQRDPIGLGGGIGLYGYVGNNPISFGDVDGLNRYDMTRGDISNRAGGSMHLQYNEVAGDIRVANAAVNGFVEGLGEGFNDVAPFIQGAGAVAEIILGGVLVCAGNPLGVFLIFDGADSLTEAVVEGLYDTDYRSFTEHAGDAAEKIGLPRQAGEGAYTLLRLWCTLRAGKYLRGQSSYPEIKSGSAGGSSAGQNFPGRVKAAARTENPTGTCVYCRRSGTAGHVDHAIAKARGGNATLPNAQLTCPHCNLSKGARRFPKTPPKEYHGKWPPRHWGN